MLNQTNYDKSVNRYWWQLHLYFTLENNTFLKYFKFAYYFYLIRFGAIEQYKINTTHKT